jgi:hypothetical protein
MKKLFAAFIGLFLFSSIAFADNRYVDSGGCTTDTKTGLVWTTDTDLTNGKVSSKLVSRKLAALNSMSEKLCGVQWWHVPTGEELITIIDSYPNLKDMYWISYRLLRKDAVKGWGGMNRNGELIKGSYFNHFIAVGKEIK